MLVSFNNWPRLKLVSSTPRAIAIRIALLTPVFLWFGSPSNCSAVENVHNNFQRTLATINTNANKRVKRIQISLSTYLLNKFPWFSYILFLLLNHLFTANFTYSLELTFVVMVKPLQTGRFFFNHHSSIGFNSCKNTLL